MRIKILIAEDNSADVFLIQYALKEHEIDAHCVVVSDGEEAFQYLRRLGQDPLQESFDLILLDLHLPKRDGPDLMACLRSQSATSQIPFIALSSSASPQDKREAERHGAAHYFRKPPSLDEFVELGGIVKRVINSRAKR